MRKAPSLLLFFLVAILCGLWVFTQTEGPSADITQNESLEKGQGDVLPKPEVLTQSAPKVVRETESATPEEESGAQETLIRLRIVDESGQGMAHAIVIPWLGEKVGDTLETDEHGMVSIERLSGAGGIAVFPRNHRNQYFPLEFTGEPIVLEVQPGGSLAGVVTFHDKNPFVAPFRMKIEFKPRYPEGMNLKVLREIFHRARLEKYAVIKVGEDGHFRFDGLPFDWSGTLSLERGYVLCSVSLPGKLNYGKEMEVSELTQNLQIAATKLPSFTGRVLTPDGLKGVEGITVRGVANFNQERMNGIIVDAKTREDGFFEMLIILSDTKLREEWCQAPEDIAPYDVDLEFVGNEQWGESSLEKTLDQEEDPWDLGDIRLSNWTELAFQLVDENGDPIAGALGYTSKLSKPTDMEGRSRIQIAGDLETFAFGARGFSSVEMEVPSVLPEELVITLARAASIQVSWTAPAGTDMSLMMIGLAGEEGVFEQVSWNASYEYAFRKAFGIPHWNTTGGDGTVRQTSWRLTKDQRSLELWGLRTGVPIQVSIVDSGMASISQVELVLKPKESRQVELEVSFRPITMSGVVVGSSGRAVSGAMVWFSTAKGYAVGSETNAQGEYSIAGVGALEGKLQVTKEDHVSFYDAQYEVPPSGACPPIILQEGRNLVLFVEDSTGRPLKGIHCKYNGAYMDVDAVATGGNLINNAPRSAFTMEWSLGGNHGSVEIPADLSEYSIEVPAMASVWFDVQHHASEDRRYFQIELIAQGFVLPARPDGAIVKSVSISPMKTDAEAEISALMPGSYLVRLWTKPFGPGAVKELLSEVGPIEFVAGENPRVQLTE